LITKKKINNLRRQNAAKYSRIAPRAPNKMRRSESDLAPPGIYLLIQTSTAFTTLAARPPVVRSAGEAIPGTIITIDSPPFSGSR